MTNPPAAPDDDPDGGGASASDEPARAREPSVIGRLLPDAGRPSILLRDALGKTTAVVAPSSGDDRRKGRYHVLGEIARGGMGVVLKARDPDLGRDVALKVLHDQHVTEPHLVQRFVEEAQIGGQLEHPGVLHVYELGVDEERRPFIAMPLVGGSTLAQLLTDRADASVDRVRLLRVFARVCNAVAYAHARGVVHRDLKPANVLVGTFGETYVMDWGIAKVLPRGGVSDEVAAQRRRDDSRVATVRSGPGGMESQVGSVMGTPSYMAPEQARGQAAELDERADVFALGAVLCEILTGAPPYQQETVVLVLLSAQRAELDDAGDRLARSGADEELVRLARDCLAAAPQDRPRDASVVARRISDYLASVEDRARESALAAARAETRAMGERRARVLTLALASVVLAALVLAGGAYLWLERGREDARRDKSDQVQAAVLTAWRHEGDGDLPRARTALESARAVLALGGPEVSADLRAEVETLAGQLGLATRREQLVHSLQELRSRRDSARAERLEAYAQVLADDGIDLASAAPESFVAHYGHDTALARAVAFAMDDSVWGRRPLRERPDEAARRRLAIATALDTDSWRGALRAAVAADDREALESLANEIDVPTAAPESLVSLAMALIGTGRQAEGLRVLERGAEAHPGHFTLQFHVAMSLGLHGAEGEGVQERVLRHALAAHALRPDSAAARLFLARAHADAGDLDGARRVVEGVVDDGRDFRVTLERARVLSRSGDPAAALAVLDELLVRSDGDLEAGLARVAILLDLGESGRAREALRSVVARERDRPPPSADGSAPDDTAPDDTAPGGGSPRGRPPRPRPGAGTTRRDDPLRVEDLPERLRPLADILDHDGDGRLTGFERRLVRELRSAAVR